MESTIVGFLMIIVPIGTTLVIVLDDGFAIIFLENVRFFNNVGFQTGDTTIYTRQSDGILHNRFQTGGIIIF